MKKVTKYFFNIILYTLPLFAWADQYPINKNIDIKHYVFQLRLTDSNDEIIGTTQVTVNFKQAGILNFRLDLINKSTEKKDKGMVVEGVSISNTTVNYTHENDALIIYLPKSAVANETITFTIKYHGIPFDGLRIGATKFGDRSFFNENWPNRGRHWLPILDHPSDKATSEFIVTAPAHYKVVSNGLLLEESSLGNNTMLTHWKQSVPVSSWLFVLGVADFAVQYVDDFEGKSIQTWVYSKNREAGFYDFKEPTKKVLVFYTKYVGPYAYEKLANIQTPSVNGGMETSSAIFYGENLVNGKGDERTKNIVVHEIAHQWFGNAVTEATWDDAWLSEGFATFFTLLYYENEYGQAEYNNRIIKAKKAVLDMTIKMPDFSIIAPRTAEKEAVTTGLTYQKGAWFLHMLRDKIGEQNFQKGIKSYYKKFYNANATTDEFRMEMEKAAGLDLKIFFKQWLYQPVNPKIDAIWTYDATSHKININLTQSQLTNFNFDIPIEIGYFTKDSKTPLLLKMNLNKKQLSQSFNVKGIPENIEVDPRNVLLSSNTITKK
ncbi:MAG: M1 family peptidase [Chitinophagaceae bacterium]|nr:M1 family peptidase [Chitinophagaceae bacterium]